MQQPIFLVTQSNRLEKVVVDAQVTGKVVSSLALSNLTGTLRLRNGPGSSLAQADKPLLADSLCLRAVSHLSNPPTTAIALTDAFSSRCLVAPAAAHPRGR